MNEYRSTITRVANKTLRTTSSVFKCKPTASTALPLSLALPLPVITRTNVDVRRSRRDGAAPSTRTQINVERSVRLVKKAVGGRAQGAEGGRGPSAGYGGFGGDAPSQKFFFI